MGLDICIYEQQEGERVGAYSMFHAFRLSLITIIDSVNTIGNIEKNEPFYELLNHSDCDGILTYADCKELKADFEYWHEQVINYANKYGDFNTLTIYEMFMRFVTKVLKAEEGERFIQFC